MRFGIMTMQREALVPPGLSGGEVLAYVATLDHAELAGRLWAEGFDPIELGGDMSLFLPHSFAPDTIDRLGALRAEHGLNYTVHLPLWSVEPSTPLQPVREGSVRALVDIVQCTLPLEPEVYVLHATGALAAEFYRMDLPAAGKGFILQQFQAGARQSLVTLLEQTGVASRRLAIETIEFPLDLTAALAEDLDLSLCLDTGHVLAGFSGAVDMMAAVDVCLPRLAEVHLHDSPQCSMDEPGYGLDHRPLGTGDLDVEGLLDRLAAAGFEGPLIFELTLEEALASMEVVRARRPALVGGGTGQA
jgi:sugar phosphate isomerase/epimerase